MEMALASLNYIQPLSPELDKHFRSILKKRKYLKREHLLKEDDICKSIWFIEKGIVGCFYEKGDRMLCSWFMKENDVTTSVMSFFQQIPSQEDIIALDDTITWYISFQELEEIYEAFPEFNKHGRKLVTNYYILAEMRTRAFHNMPPDEKYKYLMENQPEIVQRVSVKDMAKYIGMHPDALSRVRGRL